ncbi:DUF6630 family protein [Peptostreptococcus stomatis]|uniref:DUF6630 family protein n=1 Tax=Peptostreptococcus stomatis TaxID=341694 RepID=UPI0024A892EF|nr:hypothetical protein [Peptostreptococcus stomatis]
MSLYNLIQEKIFNTYEEWHMKSPIYDRNGFNIIGIDNSLKAMRDGYITYTEIYPPHDIKCCSLMKAVVGKSKNHVDIYMDIDDKKYWMPDLTYDEAIKIMRNFVKKSILPSQGQYFEAPPEDNEAIKESFYDLAKLLLGDSSDSQKFIGGLKIEGLKDIDNAWEELYEEVLQTKRAFDFDWKTRKDVFIPVLKELIVNMNLDIDLCKLDELDRNILDQDEAIPQWGAQINSMWTDYILAGMDVGSDSYVVLILTREDFAKAKELARGILQRIALLEEM